MHKHRTKSAKICEHCERSFTPPNKRQRFCSRPCATFFHEAAKHVPPETRFWSKVDKSGECWLWTGHRLRDGYGQFALAPQHPVKAHRYVWEITHGPIPDGLFVCHHCDNPSCVRPDHLFVGTPKDNTQDSIQKQRSYAGRRGPSQHRERYRRGERNQNAKLTVEQVQEIRRQAAAVTYAELAARYGVSFGLIGHIVKRRAWKHIA